MSVGPNGVLRMKMSKFLNYDEFVVHYESTNRPSVHNKVAELKSRAAERGVKVTTMENPPGHFTITFVGPPADIEYIRAPTVGKRIVLPPSPMVKPSTQKGPGIGFGPRRRTYSRNRSRHRNRTRHRHRS